MSIQKQITAINLTSEIAILNTNEIIPITSIIPHIVLPGVFVCVAGPCYDDKWYVFRNDDFSFIYNQ